MSAKFAAAVVLGAALALSGIAAAQVQPEAAVGTAETAEAKRGVALYAFLTKKRSRSGGQKVQKTGTAILLPSRGDN